MKLFSVIVALLTFVATIFGQAPQAFNYQAVLRDADGLALINQSVALQISIIHGFTDGPPVYMEIHKTQTNEFGIINVAVGEGQTSGDLATLDWADGPYFMEIAVDGEAMGSSPLLSVPYALYSASGTEGPVGPQGEPGDSYWLLSGDDISYSDGKVGIGTYAPEEKLDVNGNLNVDGDILVDGQSLKSLLEELAMLRDMNGIGTVTDYDGNVYRTVKIGEQIWMAENLRVTHLNDGTELETDTAYIDDYADGWGCEELTFTVSECTWYDYELSNLEMYGALYAHGLVRSDKLCPSGWHISTHQDWEDLMSFLGGADMAGGKLKSTGTEFWESPNQGATNESGFSALPGGAAYWEEFDCAGYRFVGLGGSAYFWVPDYPSYPPDGFLQLRGLSSSSAVVSSSPIDVRPLTAGVVNMFSVICVKD